MLKVSGFTRIFLYILVGFFFALTILFVFFVPTGKLSMLDILRLFLSPGIIALIAATFGAWIGTKSNIKATQANLAQTYISLLDLMKEDIRINIRIMSKVLDRFRIRQAQNRPLQPKELSPESAHTMFFEDIEFHKLRQLTSVDMIADIFNIRNMRYVFDHWNDLVAKYYREGDQHEQKEGERELLEHLTIDSPDSNFITAGKKALDSIDLMQSNIVQNILKKV